MTAEESCERLYRGWLEVQPAHVIVNLGARLMAQGVDVNDSKRAMETVVTIDARLLAEIHDSKDHGAWVKVLDAAGPMVADAIVHDVMENGLPGWLPFQSWRGVYRALLAAQRRTLTASTIVEEEREVPQAEPQVEPEPEPQVEPEPQAEQKPEPEPEKRKLRCSPAAGSGRHKGGKHRFHLVEGEPGMSATEAVMAAVRELSEGRDDEHPVRYSELVRAISDMSEAMLSTTLRTLGETGFLRRIPNPYRRGVGYCYMPAKVHGKKDGE